MLKKVNVCVLITTSSFNKFTSPRTIRKFAKLATLYRITLGLHKKYSQEIVKIALSLRENFDFQVPQKAESTSLLRQILQEMATKPAMKILMHANRLTNSWKSRKLHLNSCGPRINVFPAAPKAPLLRAYGSEKSAEKEVPEGELARAAGAADIVEATKGLTQQVEKLNVEVKELKEKNEDLLDKYKRALADSENLRIRLNKQIADAKVFGIQSFCKDLLEVADTLGHATDAVPKEQLNETNPHLKNLYEGLTMTKASLLQVFKRHGLVPVNPINEKFDPNVHEALFQKDEPNVEPNTVVEVTKLGYKLHDRCIRPALVGVSKS